MTIPVNLIKDTLPVLVCDRTAQLGGSFYYEPLRPYGSDEMEWAWEQLSRYARATLLDVGASTGCFSLLAKHHPDLTVHAFEPVDKSFSALSENIHLNALEDKVTLNHIGVSNYNGTGILHTVKADGGSGVSMVDGKPAWHKDTEDSAIDVTMLDTYCAKHSVKPTLIKIDVEGSELRVLQGAEKTIAKHHPFLIVEYSAENADQYGIAVHDIIKLIEAWDYVWTNPAGNNVYCVSREWEQINGELK